MEMPRLPRSASGRWKLAAMIVAGVPVAMLALFTVGEAGTGDLSGLSHLLQLAPLLIVLGAAWRWPLAGGGAMVVIALILSAVYAVLASDNIATAALIATELLFFAPAIASGLLFVHAGRLEAREQ